MMKVYCRTNLDNYKREEWPKVMCCRPMIGDRVEAKNGQSLKVVGITHSIERTVNNPCTGNNVEPYLIVELNK